MEHWLGEETVVGWKMKSRANHEKVAMATVRMWFSMWLTSNVEARRARKQGHLSEEELKVIGKCAMCSEQAEGKRNEHLCSSARRRQQ